MIRCPNIYKLASMRRGRVGNVESFENKYKNHSMKKTSKQINNKLEQQLNPCTPKSIYEHRKRTIDI